MPTLYETSSLSIRPLANRQELVQITDDWNRLAGETAFSRWEWYDSWLRFYGGEGQLLTLAVLDGSRCVGIAPMYVVRKSPIGQTIRFLGSGEVCSDHQTILSQSGREAEVGKAAALWLAEQNAGPHRAGELPDWDFIDLSGFDRACPTMHAFLDTLGQCGFTSHERSTVSTWRVELPQDIESYLAMLSKPSRRKVRSALKQFDKGQYQVGFAEDDASFEQIWDSFVDLHQRRRNSLGEQGCFASDQFAGFLRQVATRYHAAGLLDFVCVHSDQHPIASEICFRGGKTTFAYQIGIDPDALRHNPGWLVNAASIRRAIELGQTGFDLCRGDSEYKRRLGAVPTPCAEVRVVPPRLRSRVWDAALVTGSAAKDWCKSHLSLAGNR